MIVCLQVTTYDEFLDSIDQRLLGALRTIDVIRFWRSAGGMEDGEPWLAVFAIDEARHQSSQLAGHLYTGPARRFGGL